MRQPTDREPFPPTLDRLLAHAASAARIVGHLDGAIAAGPLGDHLDAIVHGLTELRGEARTLAQLHVAGSGDRVVSNGMPLLTFGTWCLLNRRHLRSGEPRLGSEAPRFTRDDAFYVLFDVLRDNIRLADESLTGLENLLRQSGAANRRADDGDNRNAEDDALRLANHAVDLLGAARLAVRAAVHIGNKLTQPPRGEA